MAIIIETCPNCGHDLQDLVICTYPPIPRKECHNCGWSWEGEREEVIRRPFGGNANNKTTVTTLNGTTNTLATVTTLNENTETLATISTLNDYLNDDNLKGSLVGNFEQSPCDSCSNNVKNGGSGHCNCILGTPKVTC